MRLDLYLIEVIVVKNIKIKVLKKNQVQVAVRRVVIQKNPDISAYKMADCSSQ